MARARRTAPEHAQPTSASAADAIQARAEQSSGGPLSERPSASGSRFALQASMRSPSAAVPELQLKGRRGRDKAKSSPIEVAEGAFQGGGSSLPHKKTVEGALGADMSGVQAFTGKAASEACESLGAQAFTVGNKIAFKDASPSKELVAHEATHVVQQSKGVSLAGGVGKAGDKYEVEADAVASKVGQGQAATDQASGGKAPPLQKSSSGAAVQYLGDPLDKPLPEGAEAPEHGETPGKQRRYSVDQYVEMWEAERGRAMSATEKKTLARGCIGITALNLEAGNPPLDHSFASFDQAMKLVNEWNAFIEAHKGETTSEGKKVGDFKAVLFAKLFWSNQSRDPEERKKPDKDAYLPDEETGRVDMSDYEYRAQPGYINFDYGFWDEGSNCFWHANHAEPGMEVYQSTKDKFAKGYIDFDRVIYCAVIARSYKAAGAAAANP
jgi:hypothetical protein